ncbi:MAG: class I SAM-dependent RNA methyltransferase [Alphaproteobacteria bacterium]
MSASQTLDIFIAAPPGLEPVLREEAVEAGFGDAQGVPGGITIKGDWPAVWRANLMLRGASRVLVRVGAFPAQHLAQLDKRARRLPWADLLARDIPISVEAVCKGSRIYHSGAAAERVAKAATAIAGARTGPEAPLKLLVRIQNNQCTISLDTSGDLLHKRGFKQAVGPAPLRETLAALLLRMCGYRGTEPVMDPMCGSGTFILEAADMALGLHPGRARTFAFEKLPSFDAAAWDALKSAVPRTPPAFRLTGSDRDRGAVTMARANAARAGLTAITAFYQHTVSDLPRPDGPPGLVVVNPPYGARLGDANALKALYAALGRTLKERFAGWRIGLITSEPALAKATALPFRVPGPPVPHGDLRIRLYQTGPL